MSSPSISTDGAFNFMLMHLADMLSRCESFQIFAGVDPDTEGAVAATRARIGLYGQPASVRTVTEESNLTGGFAVVDIDGPYGLHSVGSGAGMTYASRGSVVIHIEGPVVLDEEESSLSEEAAMVRMAQQAGLIMHDLGSLSSTDATLPLHRIGKLEGPTLANENEPHTVKPARAWYQLMAEVGV
jgi:hypothetical protein